MKLQKFKRGLAAGLAAALCLTSATAFALADNSAPSGQPGGTPPSGSSSSQPGTPPDGSSSGQPGTPPDGAGGGGGGADTMTYDYSGTLSGALTADGKAVKSSDGESLFAPHGRPERGAGRKRRHADDHEGHALQVRRRHQRRQLQFLRHQLHYPGSQARELKAKISGSSSASSQGSNGIFATDSATGVRQRRHHLHHGGQFPRTRRHLRRHHRGKRSDHLDPGRPLRRHRHRPRRRQHLRHQQHSSPPRAPARRCCTPPATSRSTTSPAPPRAASSRAWRGSTPS
jgi:hypothetical protein